MVRSRPGATRSRPSTSPGSDINHFDCEWSECEPLTIDKATPAISTTVKDSGGTAVDKSHQAALGNEVHDTATLEGKVGSFSFDTTAKVTYHFYKNNICTKDASNPTDQEVTVEASGGVPASTLQTLGAA